MCGICGIAGIEVSSERISDMLLHMSHRGPDASGQARFGRCVLGHRRLSVIDLSEGGDQPFLSGDGLHALVANGEIYNYRELRRELQQCGHEFLSQSDSEVLLHGWREWREALLPRLQGMFAFAIWDEARQALTIARDRLGIKPVYYHLKDGRLLFSSEIKPLIAGTDRWKISELGLAQYLTYQNCFGDQTLLHDIRILPPGQFLTFCDGAVHCRSFWEPHLATSYSRKTYQEACQEYREVATRSIERHLVSDVPLASYLSAGIDSSIVTTVAAQGLDGRLNAFTGAFGEGAWYDEASGASKTAGHVGVAHHVTQISPEQFIENIDDLAYALDEPRMGMGSFSQFMVAKNIARTHKVVLTGHGGDEFFSGYPVFKVLDFCSKLGTHPLKAIKTLSGFTLAEMPHLAYFGWRRLAAPDENVFLPVLFDSALQAKALRSFVVSTLRDVTPSVYLKDMVATGDTSYDQLLLTYLRAYLPGLLVVEDKISMWHSLESRTPLLDNELLDLALSLPPHLKLHGNTLKAIPKSAFRSLLPGSLYQLPKRGFPTPLRLWLRGPLQEWLRKRLEPSSTPLSLLFKPEWLQKEVESYLKARSRYIRPLDEIRSHRMWMLLLMDAWLKNTEQRLGVSLTI